MAKILVHITQGPENPTVATLGFLVAKTAMEEGHTVSVFLAGEASQLLRDTVLDNLMGLGTGKLRDHFDALKNGGIKFYISGLSAKSRSVSEADLKEKNAEFAMPNVLVKLAVEYDKTLCY